MSDSSPSLPSLPEEFLFGVATADHQCEAYQAENEDIRDIWEQRRHLTARGRATEFWNRYPEDIKLAQELGCNAFRFSLSWSRLEPKQGAFSEEAFAHYQQVIKTIRAAGMEPVVTLLHWTWPVHVEERGGLVSEDFPTIFAAYAQQVSNRLGQQVRYWITLNEPTQLIYGYIKPWWEPDYFMPPGLSAHVTLADQLEFVSRSMRNLFLAHTAARQIITLGNPAARVGTNPMLLGLPVWLQRLIDHNVTRLCTSEDWVHQGHHFAEPVLLEHGKGDVVVATLTVTPRRARDVDFSEVYYIASQALLVHADSSVEELQDLVGKKVALVKSSTSQDTFSMLLPESSMRIVNTYADALRKLDHGHVGAILGDRTILAGLMQPPDRYRLLANQLTTEPYAVAVAKGNPALLEAVDRAVRRFKDSGAWAASFAQHFPDHSLVYPPHMARRATLHDINGIKPDQSREPTPSRKTQMKRIRTRGHLIVAVKEDVPGLGFRDPQTGELSGLEIDLARAIAMEIFGDPGKIVFRPVRTQQRLPFLRSILRMFNPLSRLYSILSTTLTSNWWHLGMAGKLPEFLCPQECVDQQDFVGIDYYWGISTLQPHRIQQLMSAAIGHYDHAPVWPQALYGMLKYHAKLFPGKEILIIENGCVDATETVDRAEYLRQHIRQVQRARRDGVNVTAYICWSITSNREWGLPFGPGSDFGLYHIELDTDPALKRLPTHAAEVYREIIKSQRKR